MTYVDSSVLIAAAQEGHADYNKCHKFLDKHSRKTCITSLHSLFETYEALTSLPKKARYTPSDAAKYVKGLRKKVGTFALSPDDLMDLMETAGDRGLREGEIYSAIHIHTALAIGADIVVTLNAKAYQNFQDKLKYKSPKEV